MLAAQVLHFDIPEEALRYAPRITEGAPPALQLTIDGALYEAHAEDGVLIVHGLSAGGRTFPMPRPDSYVVRVDGFAEMKGLALLG